MAFCVFCGARLAAAAVFCGQCGNRVGGTPAAAPAPAPVVASRASLKLARLPLRPWVLVALAGAAALLGIAFGFFTAGDETDGFTSAAQASAIASRGEPAFWVLADGPISPGEDVHRVELWYYPDEAIGLRFVDGVETGHVSGEIGFVPGRRLSVSPGQLHRDLSRTETEALLGEAGVALDMDSDYPGSSAFFYRKSALLVTYLGDRFFTAQMYHPGETN
ncbi:MAG: zinc ribbon domain-containing protein [Dehalococcoidia bacterium]|uniref:zinc ribbon domain-containing protein n=1 Tax=Candidatus Amarobacter glycogenicus TaxID=3140699 RepID=UPI003135DA65|nr:zinc ribbon domain-containing protein [Dehalococcoidia bacterium]